MTILSRIISFFPAFILLLTGAAIFYFLALPSIFSILAVLLSIYGLPVLVYRLHEYFYPVREGISYLQVQEYSPWWGSHQIQLIYIAIPVLETLLRLIPGLFSWWLRLWGAKVGKDVYWTPALEISDRGFLEIGDRVVIGHRVGIYSHIIKPRKADLMLYVKKVKIGSNVFIGAGSHLAPGVVLSDDTFLRLATDLYPNQKDIIMRPIIQLFGKILAPNAQGFQRALNHPELTQRLVQREIVARLINSAYGRALGINSIKDWRRVPLVDYEDIIPWLKPTVQHRKYQQISLTPEPILFFEKTSGSSGAMKLIPYTQSLRRSFNQMFCIWAYDLIINGPDFSKGKIYACISPKLNEVNSQTLQNDLDYLDGWLRYFLRPWLLMSNEPNKLTNISDFKHQLALALLKAEDLEIISIWSPTFLQVHLKYIQENQQLLQVELHRQISLNRLKLLKESPIPWEQIWPNLKLISCWDSANAADQAQGLRSQFPGVLVQGKGLLATEAPLTVPLIKAGGHVPVLDEVFFEFEDHQGVLLNLTELTIGQEYRLILSQKGGLYRYRLGDCVRVTHYYQNTPCLEFLGRYQSLSDLVGEKLSETFVNNALTRLNLPSTNFKSLVPVATPPHYLLLLDGAEDTPAMIAQKLDGILSESYHYGRARGLGQLEPPEVFISPHIPELLVSHHIRTGSIWGGIKHPILATSPLSPEILQDLRKMYYPE